MSRPKEHVHITFLTPWIVFVGILGYQSLTNHYERPCSSSTQANYLQHHFVSKADFDILVSKTQTLSSRDLCRFLHK